jgi:HEAT repeat protein
VLEVAAPFVLAVVVAVGVHLAERFRRRGPSVRLQQAADSCGLTNVVTLKPRAWGHTAPIQGEAGPLRVRFERQESLPPTVAMTIEPLGHGSSGLRLARQRASSSTDQPATDIQTGDPAFDAAAVVEGARDLVFALLDADTRRQVRALMGPGMDPAAGPSQEPFTVEHGALRAVIEESVFDYESAIAAHTGPLLALAQRLVAPQDLPQRLVETIGREPVPAVRARALAALASEYPDTPLTRSTAQALLADAAAEVRLQAALALGEAGDPVLVQIASDEATPDGIAARALAKLGARIGRERAQLILKGAVPVRRDRTAVACIKILAARADDEVVRALIRALRLASDEVSAEAAHGLGRTGLPAAESGLLDALVHSASMVRLAAVQALGRMGTAVCIPALKQAGAARSATDELREAARDAVAAVQARLPGATPGQLSLAAGDAGQLSLPADNSGAVTVTDE